MVPPKRVSLSRPGGTLGIPARGKLSYVEPGPEAYETDKKGKVEQKGINKILPLHRTLGSVDPVHGGYHWSVLGSEEGGVWQASREPGSV